MTTLAHIDQKYIDQAIVWRRYLHAHPELSFEEHKTAQYIYDEMSKLRHVSKIERLTPTSLVVVFDTKKDGAKIGLRADIDALPIQEDRPDLPFVSQTDGKMHACGHDGHSAVLMAACQYIDEHFEAFTGVICAIFQHAEEQPPGGAIEMVATGYFDDFDFIYGQHLMSTLPLGVIDIKAGSASANSDVYRIKLIGKGGHAAMPEQTIDPVVIGAQFVVGLQSIVARKVSPYEPMVISNTIFQAGQVQNVIPHSIELAGSVRTVSPEGRAFAKQHIEALLKGLCEANGASYEFDFQEGYDVVYNNPEKTAIVKEIVAQRFPDKLTTLPAMMGGEDFAAFSAKVPSHYAFIGAGNAEKGFDYPHHHPKFGIDEDSFFYGIAMMVDIAKNAHLFK